MNDKLLRYTDEEFVFIDCETFNLCLNRCHNLPWQVAMIKVRGDKKIDERNFKIRWDTNLKISAQAAAITRFNQEEFDRVAISPERAFPDIQHWLNNAKYIAGHNVLGFDIYLIKDYYKSMGAPYGQLYDKIVDTYALAKGITIGFAYKPEENFLAYQYKMIHKKAKGTKLSMAALGKTNEIKHDYEGLHDAINDLELNLKIWNKLKWVIEK